MVSKVNVKFLVRYSLLLFFFALTDQKNIFGQELPTVKHSFFLLGDAGEPYINDQPLGKVLRQKILNATSGTTVLFLGDNIYPEGMSDPDSKERTRNEAILSTQVNWIKGTNAKGIFIPGNHDWQQWGKQGDKYVVNQQNWIDDLKDEHITFYPKGGCPGPVEIFIDKKLLLVILDTQWILHAWSKPGKKDRCSAGTTAEVLNLLQGIFDRNKDKRIIVAAHHPILTYGSHGGIFTLKDHIFPLTAIRQNLFLPLPVLGSLYPLFRKMFPGIQDTRHPKYKSFTREIEKLLKENPGSIYVSGHEHGLQYIVKDNSHFIVSGSASKTTRVKRKGYARFAKGLCGFVQLSVFENGGASVHYFEVDKNNPSGKEIFIANLEMVKK